MSAWAAALPTLVAGVILSGAKDGVAAAYAVGTLVAGWRLRSLRLNSDD